MAKRIILLLDGTWNDADFGQTDTNIVRLREVIARTLWAADETTPTQSQDGSVVSKSYANVRNIVFYERGVGTGAFLNRFFGGALGQGLSQNIRRAYKFLSFHYEPGDQVFVFGFSRGAFTARSLVGYVHAAGLLKRDNCTQELEQRAWEFYRTSPNDRSPGAWAALTPFVHEREKLRISCLGVFDTVGALGVPFKQFKVFNRDNNEFHDVELCAAVDVNLHALAIDEQRKPFEAAPWRKSKFKTFNTVVEQVWFPGAHADIGGGYIPEELRVRKEIAGLDDLTLDWMLKRVKKYFPDFPVSDAGWPPLSLNMLKDRSLAKQHQSRTGPYFIWPRALRSINNVYIKCKRLPFLRPFSEVNVGRDRHAEPTNEMLHISAVERINREIEITGKKSTYLPKNLQSLSCPTQDPPTYQLPIVGWDGEILSHARRQTRDTSAAI
ncbi:MAG: DUF2235 domain-containing protein [Afipia sp.]|nr:DUF2235 domain-containing protein [Afipia sp.]